MEILWHWKRYEACEFFWQLTFCIDSFSYSCKRPLKEDLELMEHSSDSDGDFTISFVSIVAGEEQQIVENYSIQVHSDILMARSSYFCQLLKVGHAQVLFVYQFFSRNQKNPIFQ